VIRPTTKFITPEEYLALEEKAVYKSEYHDGKIYALAGASSNHNLITGNAYMALRQFAAPEPRRVYVNDMRLQVEKSGLYTYPDVMVVCGKIDFVSGRNDTLTNPILIVEVLSESTEAYDRGEKFAMYRQIPTLQDYVLIEQTKPYVEYFRREGRFWVLETFEQMEATLTLRSLDFQIPLETIYSQAELTEG
jgi:Uma2 family endonuclease